MKGVDALPSPSQQVARVAVRVSAVKGRDIDITRSDFISPDVQIEAGRSASRLHDWQFDGDSSLAYMDLNVSGSRKSWKKRRGLMQHLADARAGKINVLIFYKLSRLARNVREGLEIWDAFERAGCAIYICKESIDSTTAVGRMIRSILLAVAEMQAEDIAEWAEEMHERRALSGKAPPTLPAWITRTEDGTQINDAFAAPIRRLVELRLAGTGYTRIARTLNAEGHRMVNGRLYTTGQVMSLLTGDALGRLAGEVVYHTAGQGITLVPDAYPAIATQEEVATLKQMSKLLRPGYDSANYPKSTGNGTRGKSLTTAYILSSLLWCSVCGAPLRAATGGQDNQRAYCCNMAREDGTRHEGGKGFFIIAEPAENAVINLLRTLVSLAPPPISAPRKTTRSRPVRTSEDIQREMSELVQLLLAKRIRPQVYDENYARLETELAALDREEEEGCAQHFALSSASQALESQDYRAVCLHLIKRVEVPVFLSGLEYIKETSRSGKQYGNGRLRRCMRVTTLPKIDGQDTWVVPIYRMGYRGKRDLYRADGTLLTG